MRYSNILQKLAEKESVPIQTIEDSIQSAIRAAGLDCTPEQFIETAASLIAKKTIYNTIV